MKFKTLEKRNEFDWKKLKLTTAGWVKIPLQCHRWPSETITRYNVQIELHVVNVFLLKTRIEETIFATRILKFKKLNIKMFIYEFCYFIVYAISKCFNAF